jgi:hypothetical protein
MLRYTGVVLLILFLHVGVWAQDTPADFIEAAIDNPAPYVGQPVMFTWRWFLATANAGSTNDSTNIELPDFAGFGQETLPVGDPQSQLINGRQYQVITQQIVLYPLQAGILTIAPIRINTPETPFAPAIFLETQSITVNVQALPQDAPTSFRNAVGQFDLSSSTSTTAMTAGQPVTFAVMLTGTGNITQVLAPELPPLPNWRVYPQPTRMEQSTAQVGTRIFEWTLIPLQAGAQRLPSVELSYFNPQTQSYQTVQTAPITLDVMPGAAPQATLIPDAGTDTAPTPIVFVLKPLPNVLGTSEPRVGMQFWLLWLFPPLVVGGLWVMQRQPSGVDAQPRMNASRALQQAQARLKSVTGMTPRAASEGINTAILEYLGAKAGKPVNSANISQILGGVPDDLRQRLRACIEQSAAARYAPVSVGDVTLLLKETAALLVQVDKAWKK